MQGIIYLYLRLICAKASFFFNSFLKTRRIIAETMDTPAIVSGALSQSPVSPSEFKAKMNAIGKTNALPTEMSVANTGFATAVI